MKLFGLFLSFVLLLFAFSPAIQPALAKSSTTAKVKHPSAGAVNTIYLPLIENGQVGSFELIDQDIASGKITAEQGLVYKVYALFSDALLPTQYIGSGTANDDGNLLMRQVVEQASTLSNAAKQALTPFFVPPTDSDSWYYRSKLGSSSSTQSIQPKAGDPSWSFISAAGGKIRVFYWSANASDQAKATSIAAEVTSTIWPKLTTLMNKTPIPNTVGTTDIYLWNSYIDTDGTVVVFDPHTKGITIPGTNQCQAIGVTIYLPDRLPTGSPTSPGLIQEAVHELMHAIQFAYPMAACPPYDWLMEATAKWSEDYVYPLAESEHKIAHDYLERPSVRLDNTTDLHQYGAYLLFYYLTHAVDPTAQVIRQMWENAAGTTNSYQAVDNAVNQIVPSMHDYYWTDFLIANWNQAPFGTYYQTNDRLTNTVTAESHQTISAANGDEEIPLNGSFPTGGARYYQFNVDSSVSSLTILNGLGKNLSIGAGTLVDLTSGDEMYQSADLTGSDAAGATLVALMKVAGSGWQPIPLGGPSAQLDTYSHCVDVQGQIEDLVIIQSNADFANPDRIMSPQGLPTTVFASNLPCWKVTGSAKYTIYNHGVSKVFSTQDAVYSYPSAMTDLSQYPYVDDVLAYPSVQLSLLSADVSWSVSGTDSNNCVYSGSGNFTVSEEPGYGSQSVTIFNGILSGSPTYRGYEGWGSTDDDGSTITYSVTGGSACPGSETDPGPFEFLGIPMTQDRADIKVPAGGGALSGSYKQNEPLGAYELMEWNLNPVTK